MKKLSLMSLVVLGALFLTNCKKETPKGNDENTESGLVVENKQRSFLGYVTATWCGPCGQYGGPNFKSVVEQAGDNVIALNFQTSNSRLTPYFKRPSSINIVDSTYITPILNGYFASLNIPTNANGGYSIPSFSMNNGYIGTSLTPATVVNNINTFNQNAPVVGVAAKRTISGNKITVEAKAKFFQQGNGEYFWSAIVLEKDIIGYQVVGSTPSETYNHKMVARASMQGGKMYNQTMFGSSFANGSVNSGQEFTKTFELEFENYTAIPGTTVLIPWSSLNSSTTQVAVMVWKKNGTKYEFVNGFLAK